MNLGDRIESALTTMGITKERVETWLGNCGCQQRQEKLNALGYWAQRVLAGYTKSAHRYFNELTSDN
jgi:hypothetical protein